MSIEAVRPKVVVDINHEVLDQDSPVARNIGVGCAWLFTFLDEHSVGDDVDRLEV